MMRSLLASLFGCAHPRTTFPILPRAHGKRAQGNPYVVCLECGKTFEYDWHTMRQGAEIHIPPRPTKAIAVMPAPVVKKRVKAKVIPLAKRSAAGR